MEVSFQKGYLLKSSWLSPLLGLWRLLFQKLTCLDFGTCPFSKKCDFAQIWSDLVYFNLEILKDWNLWTSGPFGPWDQNAWAPRPFGPGLVPCWTSRVGDPGGDSPLVKPTDGGDDDGVPTTLPISQDPWGTVCKNQISRAGDPSL